MNSRGKAFLAAAAAEAKLADQVVVLDLQEQTPVTDFFVIATGTSGVQIKAITEAVEDALAAAGEPSGRAEGREGGRWVLLDFGDIVVHIFGPREREYYGLEKLWGDAPVLARDAPALDG